MPIHFLSLRFPVSTFTGFLSNNQINPNFLSFLNYHSLNSQFQLTFINKYKIIFTGMCLILKQKLHLSGYPFCSKPN